MGGDLYEKFGFLLDKKVFLYTKIIEKFNS